MFVVLVACSLSSFLLGAQEAEGRVDLGGAEIFYRTYGSGPALPVMLTIQPQKKLSLHAF